MNPRTLSPLLRQAQCLRHAPKPSFRPVIRQHQFTGSSRRPNDLPRNPLDPIALQRIDAQRRAHYNRRSYYAGAGMAFSMVAIYVLMTSWDLPPKPLQNDSPRADVGGIERGTPVVGGVTGGTEIRKVGEGTPTDGDKEKVEQVPTGTSTIPTFPKILNLATDDSGKTGGVPTEYHLMGLGIRTVSFLGIQVYVVGLYIATDDIAALQQALIRHIDPVATTLVPNEKDKLRTKLLDAEIGEEIWTQVLKESGIRTAVRIVPTRNTDFMHLRDGWVRGITTRTQKASQKGSAEFEDEGFAKAMGELKGIFSAGSKKALPKGKTLLLTRDGKGVLQAWCDDAKMGEVRDERVGRQVWLGYLAGKNVASEGTRRNVVEGVMEFVERPVGTVATQVV
ncbi:MAG: Altered inheritance of mitochondria protein 18 mitochondrial [Pleopsidium flavum]|nr:MAG: Altered inheritance of mitochondria protein 18 mitochondrial [Pleopsidium flavum]